MIPTLAEILDHHVTLEIESIDRMYLNGYISGLQTPAAVAWYLRHHRGATFASSVLLDPISRDFERAVRRQVEAEKIPVHRFTKGERKDDWTQKMLKGFTKPEGILYLGTAQEKMTTVRTEKRTNPQTGATFPWLVRMPPVNSQ